MPFFESLRTALSRYAAMVHTVSPPLSSDELAAVQVRLPWPLPAHYVDFLRSYNGVSLFHEALLLHPISAVSAVGPLERFLRIGDSPDGELWLDRDGRLRLVDEETPDPIICGSTIENWLDATLGREALVVDRQGEFRDVFDEDGEALSEVVRRKRARVGARLDPGAALYPYEQAELLCEDGDLDGARQLLQQAVALDPEAGPAWELLSSLLQKLGQLQAAEHAALQAAAATWAPFFRASRLLDAAELAPERAAAHAAAAAAADREHGARLLEHARELLVQDHGERQHPYTEAQRLVQRVRLLLQHGEAAAPPAAQLASLERELRTRGALRVL
jgi:tetratricopeptide (TPR) repeat protein